MTVPARISQADIERAAKAAKNAGWPSARMKLDLVNGTIDLILSNRADTAASDNEWDEEIEP
jgi:hypothetical protein